MINEKNDREPRQRPVTILYFGTYEETYSRNQIMIKSLKRMGHIVKECHVSLWGNRRDKTKVFKNGHETFILLFGLLTIYPRLLLKYLFIGHYDILFVGYLGHLDVLIVKFLEFITRRQRKIVFDVFISLYDTIVNDREMVKKESFLAKLIFWLDLIACSLADVILLDTQTHIKFFKETFKVPKNKMVKIYASADTDIFYPRKIQERAGGFHVLFMGKYTPLHGIEYIVEAADLLKNQPDIQFLFIGKGQLYKRIRALVDKKGLNNVGFIQWVAYEILPDYVKKADICLGVFSKSEKANRVIPNKIFQAMAMGKPVISGKTDAVLECLTHKEDIFLCELGNPTALSEAILTLKSDTTLRNRIGAKAVQTFEEALGNESIIRGLKKVLDPIAYENDKEISKIT